MRVAWLFGTHSHTLTQFVTGHNCSYNKIVFTINFPHLIFLCDFFCFISPFTCVQPAFSYILSMYVQSFFFVLVCPVSLQVFRLHIRINKYMYICRKSKTRRKVYILSQVLEGCFSFRTTHRYISIVEYCSKEFSFLFFLFSLVFRYVCAVDV